MLFSNKDDKGNATEKKRSLLGLLFNPRIDRDIAPIKENASMFVHMLATLFMSAKLFPKDHPAFSNPQIRLTMREVIGTAYSNLSLTKEGIPQIIYFCAVVGVLAFSVLFLLTFILSLFMGTAHAQSAFDSPAPDTDWAIALIKYLFMAENVDIGIEGAIPDSSHGIQKALGIALEYYSKAVLVLAGILLLYHLTFMVAETAHTGKPMGQANQIWAPIRLVVAIGLLVPVAAGSSSSGQGNSSTSVNGYNTGQYIGMQVAMWGSGLASNVWHKFLTATSQSEYGCDSNLAADKQPPSCLTMKSKSEDIIKHFLLIDACAYMYNHYLSDKGIGLSDSYKVLRLNEVMEILKKNTKPKSYYLSLKTISSENAFNVDPENSEICGGFTIQTPPEKGHPFYGVYNHQNQLLKTYGDFMVTFANEYAPYYISNSDKYGKVDSKIQEKIRSQLVSYVRNLQEAVDIGSRHYMKKGDEKLKKKYIETDIGKTGWLSAGAWFNSIIGNSATRAQIFYKSMPDIIAPTLYSPNLPPAIKSAKIWDTGERAQQASFGGVKKQVQEDLKKYAGMIEYEIELETKEKGVIKGKTDEANSEKNDEVDFIDFSMSGIKDLILSTSTNVFNTIMKGIDSVGGHFGIWEAGTNKLGIKFGIKHNPLAELADYGQKNVEVAMKLYTIGGFITAIGTLPLITGSGVGGFASIFYTVAGIFLLIGFTMGYIVPLYPFFRFFFGSVTWLMSVFELIIAVPLWALAHINPNGAGLAGDKAQYGYSMIMQVLLRPVLMVFGLIAGYLIFSATIFFLNNIFLIAAEGTGAFSGSFPIVAKMVYSILYCAIALILANQCFSTIGLFPQTALKWLGMGGVEEEKMSDATAMISGVATYGSKQMGAEIGGAAQSLGSSTVKVGSKIAGAPIKAGQMIKKRREKKKEKDKEKDEAD